MVSTFASTIPMWFDALLSNFWNIVSRNFHIKIGILLHVAQARTGNYAHLDTLTLLRNCDQLHQPIFFII